MSNDQDDLLARVDERLRSLQEIVGQLSSKIQNGITERIHALERKVQTLEQSASGWLKWSDLAFKAAATVVGLWVAWKLGIPH